LKKKSISAGGLPQTPLRELASLPQTRWLYLRGPLGLVLRGGTGKRRGEKGKGTGRGGEGGKGRGQPPIFWPRTAADSPLKGSKLT